VLLVCAADCPEIDEQLKTSACDVVEVSDGAAAVARIQRERFDAAVLVSTGETMDVLETAFNLKDIRQSLPIIVVTEVDDRTQHFTAIAGVRYCSTPDFGSTIEAVRLALR
jgi:DNA-binding response OmpR family regulator